MQQKTDATRILWFMLWATLFTVMICTFPNCGKHHDHPPLEPVPADTVVIVITDTLFVDVLVTDTLFVVCDTVDLDIEFTLIKDQSAPNVYAIFLNGVEWDRIVISETSPIPVEVKFLRTFERFVIGRDTISIKKIEGSRAETIGSKIVKTECSS